MSIKYLNLLSPLKVGNVVLKNRMISAQALPHFLQGPEQYPADTVITHISNIAKNGAAIVTFGTWSDTEQRNSFVEDGKRFPMFDYKDPSIQNYLSQLTDAVHFYGSKASIYIMPIELPNFQPLVDSTMSTPFELLFGAGAAANVTGEMMNSMIEEACDKCKFYRKLGFDMVSIHMGWRDFGTHIGMAKFLSPLANNRTDEYGGSLENRARFPLEMCRAIKSRCGKDFLIDVQVCGEEEEGGTTVEDTIGLAKLAEGVIDILQIRASTSLLSHPTGFNSTEGLPVTLHISEAVKKSGAKLVVVPVGGYQNPDLNEAFIADGKADMISMARAFICDSEYGKKVHEGRGEDVVPCMRCAKCHVTSITGPWLFMCSANPTAGFAHKISRMIDPPERSKKVAVIGGGPAGMKAALVAAERGHKVTLFERESYLGGQLRHADFSQFKWPLKNFKNYLIQQINKSDIEVIMNTAATPELINERGFEAVITALGAEPRITRIPGIETAKVYAPQVVYGREQELGKRVVVIGGSETGTETALYLAEKGHMVTILTRQDALAKGATPYHYRDIFEDRWKNVNNFKYILNATTTSVSSSEVSYTDENGVAHTLSADSIVVSGGVTPRQEEALKFYGSANSFFMVGDCCEAGNVQKCMRTAFAAASTI